ncbi:hypothetical protein [Vibrio phage VCPH]|nr:hypothetical protein [Vibrio phage VCPH]
MIRTRMPTRKDNKRERFLKWKRKADKAHNNKYVYDNFIGVKYLVDIYCPAHHLWFKKTAGTHAEGMGHCPHCQTGTQNVLYLWKFKDKPYYKLGITSQHREDKRILEVALAQKVQVDDILVYNILSIDAHAIETKILQFMRKHEFHQPIKQNQGHTEIFQLTEDRLQSVLELIDELCDPYLL